MQTALEGGECRVTLDSLITVLRLSPCSSAR